MQSDLSQLIDSSLESARAEAEARAAAEQRAEQLAQSVKGLEAERLVLQTDAAIMDAVLEEGLQFRDVRAVRKQLRDQFRFDKHRKAWLHHNAEGNITLNNDLQPATIGQVLKQFAKENPRWLKEVEKTKADDSEPKRSGTPIVRSKADFRSNEEKSKWISKHGGTAFGKLPIR